MQNDANGNLTTTNFNPNLPAPRGAVKIAKLAHAYQAADWKDPLARYSVSYNGYVQHFPTVEDSRKYARALRAGKTLREVSNIYCGF